MLIPRSARRISSKVYFPALTIVTLMSFLMPLIFIGEEKARATGPLKPAPENRPPSAPPEPFFTGAAKGNALRSVAASYLNTAVSWLGSEKEDGVAEHSARIREFRTGDGSPIAPESKPAPNNLEEAAATMFAQPAAAVDFDFDGDGKSDIGRWHPQTKEFKVSLSNGGNLTAIFSSVSSSAKPAPADYDGDGICDAALFDAGTWYIRKSSDSNTVTQSFGQAGDIPQSGNYRNTSADELAFYMVLGGVWQFERIHSLLGSLGRYPRGR